MDSSRFVDRNNQPHFPIPRKTVPCKYCGMAIRSTGSGMCNSCWEVEQRIEEFAKAKAGRRLLWKMVWQHTWWGGLLPQFARGVNSLTVSNRYVCLHFWKPKVWEWTWGTDRPRCKNWARWIVHTPAMTFTVNGYDSWGRKPDDR